LRRAHHLSVEKVRGHASLCPPYETTRLTRDVMAGLVPAIHVLLPAQKNVDARDKSGHDDLN